MIPAVDSGRAIRAALLACRPLVSQYRALDRSYNAGDLAERPMG